MNKGLILSVSDKRHMSMASIYEEYFKQRKIPYDIIRIDRYSKEKINSSSTVHEFSINQSTDTNKINKIIPFLKFRKYALRIIKKNSYCFISVWNENTAALFGDILIHRYKGKYCVNVRDIFEIPGLNHFYNSVLKHSAFNTSPTPANVLSTGGTFYTLFNHDYNIEKNVKKKKCFRSKNEKIRITFMGLYASVPKASKTIAKLFCNDNRYELYFYGDGFDTEFKKYIIQLNSHNIFTGGAFPYEKTYEYLEKTDIINSYYNNFDISPNLPYVAGVKQSYTPLLYLPSINDEDTVWGKICKKYGFSYLINDMNINTLPDDLYTWYHSLDFETFKSRCNSFNMIIQNTQDKIFRCMDEIIK